MSLLNYGDLQQAVADELSRADFSAGVTGDFIYRAHVKLMRTLRNREMETIVTSVTISAETAALPSDWLETRKVYVTSTSPRYELQYVSFDELIEKNLVADTDIPRYYTVVGGNMQFAPIPNGNYLITHVYYRKEPMMSAASDTNWILNDHPDIYLYGALVEASGRLQDDPRIPMWQQRYAMEMATLNRQSQRAKSGPAMQVRPG